MTGYDDPGYFDRLYAGDPDPWKFATSDYERDKYAATLEALPERRFARAFEVGCSIGVLTRQLAARCDAVLAVDIAEAALRLATERCRDQAWVQFETMDLRTEWPAGRFDLILFSEVLYYLGLDGIRLVARRTLEALEPGGTILLVDWHGPTDGACTGDEAAELFIAETGRAPTVQQRFERFRIDRL